MAVTFGNLRCLDPAPIAEACARMGLPAPFAGRANSYLCTLGPDAGRGCVLLKRSQLADSQSNIPAGRLNHNGLNDLVFYDGTRRVTIKDLVVTEAPLCITPGLFEDQNRAMMLELADVRHFAGNKYWSQPVNKGYNVRCPAPGTDSNFQPVTYYLDTLDGVGGGPWSWQRILNDLWSVVNVSELGASPTLPFTPHGTPENFRFFGVSAWSAYNEVLKRVGCAFKFDPTKTSTTGRSGIVRVGVADATFTQTLTDRRSLKCWDPYPYQVNRGRVPKAVTVYFPFQRLHYGTEKFTGWDEGEQEMVPPYHTITINDPDSTTGTQTGSVASLFDDLPAILDFDDNITNFDVLFNRADERVRDYYRQFHTGVQPPMQQRYMGFLDDAGFRPGSLVTGTAWLDTGLSSAAAPQGGWLTEIVRYPMYPKVNEQGGGWRLEPWPGAGSDVVPHLKHAKLSELREPLYPPLLQPILVKEATSDVANMHYGKVLRVNVETLPQPTQEEREWCLVFDTNLGSLTPGDVVLARLNGSFVSEEEQYPLYLVGRLGGNAFFPARIVSGQPCSSGVTNPFQITEQEYTGSGNWQDKPGGRTGTAYHLNKQHFSPSGPIVAVGTIVWAVAGNGSEYVFDCPSGPAGTVRFVDDVVCCADGRFRLLRYYAQYWNGQLTRMPCHLQGLDVCAECPPAPNPCA